MAYYEPQGEQPAYLYGGYNIGYDARKGTVKYEKAHVMTENGQEIYGTPRKRLEDFDIMPIQAYF